MSTSLKQLLLGKEQLLVTKLGVSRELIEHPTEKGDAAEVDWCGALAEFLPTRYQVSNAFVIDANGETSEQIDVVIHDRHFCPLFFESSAGARYIPAESVYAAIEVKQELNREHLEYASDKVTSVRRLHRTNARIVDRGASRPPREEFEIIGGLLTLASGWTPSIGEACRAVLVELAEREHGRIDLGCAVAAGAFELVPGETPELEVAVGEGALVFFLMRLFQRLQQIGSPMVIDLREYSRSLQTGELELAAEGS